MLPSYQMDVPAINNQREATRLTRGYHVNSDVHVLLRMMARRLARWRDYRRTSVTSGTLT